MCITLPQEIWMQDQRPCKINHKDLPSSKNFSCDGENWPHVLRRQTDFSSGGSFKNGYRIPKDRHQITTYLPDGIGWHDTHLSADPEGVAARNPPTETFPGGTNFLCIIGEEAGPSNIYPHKNGKYRIGGPNTKMCACTPHDWDLAFLPRPSDAS